LTSLRKQLQRNEVLGRRGTVGLQKDDDGLGMIGVRTNLRIPVEPEGPVLGLPTHSPSTAVPTSPATLAPTTRVPITGTPTTGTPSTLSPVTQSPVTHSPVTQSPSP
jgi:hypothetical protein